MTMRIPTAVLLLAASCHAETIRFGEGENSFEMDFVTVGDPGNPPDEPDRRGDRRGAVDYVYQIAKFELNCNAFDKLGPHAGGNFCGDAFDRPAAAGRDDAAAYLNALNDDRGFPRAYKQIDHTSGRTEIVPWTPDDVGYDPSNPMRNSLARFVLPTADEWHKAAYYDPSTESYFDFATGTNRQRTSSGNSIAAGTFIFGGRADTMQAGGLSPYGTMGQTSNKSEWEEHLWNFDLGVPSGYYRAGEMDGIRNQTAMNSRLLGGVSEGFRVVYLVAEPTPNILCLIAAFALLGCYRGSGPPRF